jgi:hypothetical protein
MENAMNARDKCTEKLYFVEIKNSSCSRQVAILAPTGTQIFCNVHPGRHVPLKNCMEPVS